MPSSSTTRRPSARVVRRQWSTASELLRLVHIEPGLTRTQACERLSLASGAAAELIERLRRAQLVAERRAEHSGPGRPTTVLDAHPAGPLVVVVDMRTAGWQVVVGDLVGHTSEAATGTYQDEEPAAFLPRIAGHVTRAVRDGDGRVRAVVAVVAGTVSGTRLLQFATRGWGEETDLGILVSGRPHDSGVRFLAGNDATLGGLAEAQVGAARGARVALHVLVAVGVGGTLLLDGRPVAGGRGASGEYGHLPFGDPQLRCPCGARGCWDLMVDGRALARRRGDDEPNDPVAYALQLFRELGAGRIAGDRDRRSVEDTARSLGAGLAGLTNLHDPDVITLAGLAPDLRAAAPEAFDRAYRDGLMTFRRHDPPPVLDGIHGTSGPVRGAVAAGIEEITAPDELARWATRASPSHGNPGRAQAPVR